MGPPTYDSSTAGSIVSIRCNEKEHRDEVTQEELGLDTIWDEEL